MKEHPKRRQFECSNQMESQSAMFQAALEAELLRHSKQEGAQRKHLS